MSFGRTTRYFTSTKSQQVSESGTDVESSSLTRCTASKHDSEERGSDDDIVNYSMYVSNDSHGYNGEKRTCFGERTISRAYMVATSALALWALVSIPLLATRPVIHDQTSQQVAKAVFECRKSCPQSAMAAWAAGCVFDELENRFTKPTCINNDISNEFSVSGPGVGGSWSYRTELNGSMVSTGVNQIIDVIAPGRVVWQTTRWHLVHCIFVWRKIGLSRFDGTLIPMGRREQDEHDTHCGRLVISFLQGEDLEKYLAHTQY